MGGRTRRLDLTLQAARVVVIICAVLVIARQFGISWLFFPTAVAATPLLCGPLVVALALLVWKRRRGAMFLGAVCLALIAAWWTPVFLPGPTSVLAASDGVAAKVRFMAFNAMDATSTSARVVSAVKRERVDVLVVSECGPAMRQALVTQGVQEVLPFRVGRSVANAIVVWSRLPLTLVSEVHLGHGGHIIKIVGTGPERTSLTLLAAHPISPRWTEGRAWQSDQRTLFDASTRLPDVAVIAGDLNMTRDHKPFRALQGEGFVDALDAVGAGWQPTWSFGVNRPALSTIDHVLGRGVGFSDFRTVTISGSDHHAVVVTAKVPAALG